LTPEGEEGAANALRLNDRVLLSDGHPRTADMLNALGFRIVTLATREIAKIDAGLSCMSLRWRA
jgi:dimethylargininase